MSKPIALYTLNVCRFLCTNYTSIKQFPKENKYVSIVTQEYTSITDTDVSQNTLTM